MVWSDEIELNVICGRTKKVVYAFPPSLYKTDDKKIVCLQSDLLEIWGERKQSIVLRFQSESLCSNVAFFIRNFRKTNVYHKFHEGIEVWSRNLNFLSQNICNPISTELII